MKRACHGQNIDGDSPAQKAANDLGVGLDVKTHGPDQPTFDFEGRVDDAGIHPSIHPSIHPCVFIVFLVSPGEDICLNQVCISNVNRQIHALDGEIGSFKVVIFPGPSPLKNHTHKIEPQTAVGCPNPKSSKPQTHHTHQTLQTLDSIN